jgi:3-hydroxyisobutyrate dehydrogenase-like beta-hydroxyacid dehydrogenase
MSLQVGWIGLGAMGSGMASSLLSQGYPVKAYDVYAPSLDKAVSLGAVRCETPAAAASGVQVLALMVVNAAQVEDVLFGAGKVADVIEPNSAIIVFSTVPPSYLADVRERLDALNKGIGLVDAPVSGGFIRAAEGQLSVMVSGTSSSISTARPVLESLTRKPIGNLAVVGDKVGQASDFKLINQVLCGIHIAVTSEAMALAANLGCNPRKVYNALKDQSFMYGLRVPWQLQDDGVPKSAMTIIYKDVGIVNDEARALRFPAPLSGVAEQLFTAALGAGLAKEEDGNLIKLWERFGGKSVLESGTVEEEEKRAQAAQGGEEVIKVVGDLLNAVHTVSAAEALAFARHKGMDLDEVFNVVGTSAATSKPLVAYKDELSWPDKFEPKAGQPTVAQVLDDLTHVLKEAKRVNTPLFLTQAAQQRFAEAALKGWGDKGSSIIGHLWL